MRKAHARESNSGSFDFQRHATNRDVHGRPLQRNSCCSEPVIFDMLSVIICVFSMIVSDCRWMVKYPSLVVLTVPSIVL